MKRTFKNAGRALLLIVALTTVFALTSCATHAYPEEFHVDFRDSTIPVMFNEGISTSEGRAVAAEVFSSRYKSSSSTTYGYYTVTTTTTVTNDSAVPLAPQFYTQIAPSDSWVAIDGVWYFTDYTFMFGNKYHEYRVGVDGRAHDGGAK